MKNRYVSVAVQFSFKLLVLDPRSPTFPITADLVVRGEIEG